MDKRYQSSIPEGATETLTAFYKSGPKASAIYHLNGQLVGRRYWDENGFPILETPLREGRKHGVEYHWYHSGLLTLAEPYENGLAHGTAQQWADDGTLIGTYSMEHGTGIDLWYDQRVDGTVYLAEVYYLLAGKRHGYEWWVQEDQETTYLERHWKYGKRHGIERQWDEKARLFSGYPRYTIQGQETSKKQYLEKCERDTSLPSYIADEDQPERSFPPEIRSALKREYPG
jgi:antitoxin component YwqK of YwqJK toxin-antitoxin module